MHSKTTEKKIQANKYLKTFKWKMVLTVGMFFAVCYLEFLRPLSQFFRWTAGSVVMLLNVPKLLDFKNIVPGSSDKLKSA